MTQEELPRLRQVSPQQIEVDGFGWEVGLSLLVCGLRIGLRANSAEALNRALEFMPAGWKRSSHPWVSRLYSYRVCEGSDPEQLYINQQRVRGPEEYDGTLRVLEADLTAFLIANIRRKLCVHAGVISWKGKTVVIPGKSHTGKTTLVTALVRAGGTYYSDELAIVDVRGRVHPFARRLALWSDDGLERCTAEDLGALTGTKPAHVGMVLLTKYTPGAIWRPRRLSPGQGVIRMLEHAVSARRHPDIALSSLGEIASRAEVLLGPRGDAMETASMVLDKLSGPMYDK